MTNSFKKKERLTGKEDINNLFEEGKRISVFPFKALWKESSFEEDVAIKVVLSVPKRIFKRAVDRNRIKRLMKEAFRLNKHELNTYLSESEKQISLFVVYLGKEIPDYNFTTEKIILLLSRLKQEVSKQIKND